MTRRIHVTRNAGHPWDGRPGFDILELEADTQAELDKAVKEAASRFWQPWLIGVGETTGLPGGAMYKPCDARAPWFDSPEKPHPGNIRKLQSASRLGM